MRAPRAGDAGLKWRTGEIERQREERGDERSHPESRRGTSQGQDEGQMCCTSHIRERIQRARTVGAGAGLARVEAPIWEWR